MSKDYSTSEPPLITTWNKKRLKTPSGPGRVKGADLLAMVGKGRYILTIENGGCGGNGLRRGLYVVERNRLRGDDYHDCNKPMERKGLGKGLCTGRKVCHERRQGKKNKGVKQFSLVARSLTTAYISEMSLITNTFAEGLYVYCRSLSAGISCTMCGHYTTISNCLGGGPSLQARSPIGKHYFQ